MAAAMIIDADIEVGHWHRRATLRMRPRAVTPLRPDGFTLIEILVVMAIIALLLTLAVPRYLYSVDRAKEAVLKQNLAQMRDAIDKYHADRGRYPDALEDLVSRKYLRNIPIDPVTETPVSWIIIPPQEAGQFGVFDVKSGAPGLALDGSKFADW